jgi:hypothetical protein
VAHAPYFRSGLGRHGIPPSAAARPRTELPSRC